MTPKERFLAAVRFEAPDKPALEYYYTDVGYAEHGEKLQALYAKVPGDTSPVPQVALDEMPRPDAADILPDGSYHKLETDEWGTVWEYRIFGRIGHAVSFPLAEWAALAGYQFPAMPLSDPTARAALQRRVTEDDGEYPVMWGVPGLFERLIALRPFEEVLMDLSLEEPELEELADRLVAQFAEEAERAVAAGVDVVCIGDDYGTDRALLISPTLWRRFFLPRLQKMIAPIKRAGKLCCFHSCGQIWEILPDLKKAGADSIWPQLPLYDWEALAARLRALGLALCIHVDRGELMQNGTADEIHEYVARAHRVFRPDLGGAWFYFEVDQGFPFENVAALSEAIGQYREQ